MGTVWIFFSLYVMLDGFYGSENVTDASISIVVGRKMSEISQVFAD